MPSWCASIVRVLQRIGLRFTSVAGLHTRPFSLCVCSFVIADPNLGMMFVGEEILHSARVWTRGYDIFAPDENLVSAPDSPGRILVLASVRLSTCHTQSHPPSPTTLPAPMDTGAFFPLFLSPLGYAHLLGHGARQPHCCWVAPIPVYIFTGATCCTAGQAAPGLVTELSSNPLQVWHHYSRSENPNGELACSC